MRTWMQSLHGSRLPLVLGIPRANKYIGIGPTIGMGRSTTTVVFSACQTVNLPVGDDLLAWTVTGPFTAEAANGDLVYGTFSMSQYASGRLTLDGMAITGGTGRFSGATGSATGEGYVERPALTGWWTFRGTITRPNT